MTARDDSFLARWSRRKQAVRNAEAPAAEEERLTAEAVEAEEDGDQRELPRLEADSVDAEPPEPLPSVEDLTADSDITGFLRKGVPKALQNAALRKMWSLDPEIRDYIGPSEYAWDFNKAGSMGGFGPLEAKESVAEFLATMSRGLQADSQTAAAVSDEPAGSPPATANASDQAGTASPGQAAGASEPTESAEPPHLDVAHVTIADSAPVEHADPEQSPIPAPPRHGGAVPR